MISGTFIDEITHDIPAQNWGTKEWDRDFAAMKSMGIDTVIIIRAGYRDRCIYDSAVLRKRHPHLIASVDLMQLYLDLAEKHGMDLYFGTYDSGEYWHTGRFQEEADINLAFIDEMFAKYGDRSALKGWYISHEIDTYNAGMMNVYETLANHLRGLKKLPILISPYIRGVKQVGDEAAISFEQHALEWDAVFERIQGLVDIVAFQDGQVNFAELGDYLRVNAELAKKHGLICWSNVESFDRDMPIKFPPIEWRKLRHKIDAAVSAGVDKLITFEFSHFMSPNSIYPAAHGLYDRYREHYLETGKEAIT